MSVEYVEPVLGIANCLGPPVCKYLQYHRKLNDYVRNFKSIRDELNSKMEDIELQLKAELLHRVGKIPKKGVENWLEKAKVVIIEVQAVETKVTNGRYLRRACNAKLVDEKTKEMQTFLDKAPNVSESLVIDGPSVGLPLPTSGLVGEKAVRDEIWACLMHEEVSKIGVWGMGGVGKTTVMKHIHNDLLKQQRFERVIWVTISKNFNALKLQDDIASELKTELPKERDQIKRATILLERMKKAGKHVLILDDVWGEVSLEEVGIPEPNSNNGCKLVLTTRSEQVCKYMGCKVIKVKPLSEEEALVLFLNRVGPNIVGNQTLIPTLRLVVKECAGLPLTIVVVAGTLKGEDTPGIWKKALRELKERIGKVEGVEPKVIESLKFSYDHLKEKKVKYCFLYCALYPEDYEIWKDELIECWIDEGFIDEMDTRNEMEEEGHAILKKLVDNCLLENVSNDYEVKMHDAVRDMALSITGMNPRYMIQAGLQIEILPEEKKWTADIEKVSLMWNSISKIPIDMPPPKCQLLTTLLLQHNPIKKIPNSFFANMPCLSVLNLSTTKIEYLPDSISELKSLTALLLLRCTKLRHVPCLAELQGLKKLDLGGTQIEEVPGGLDMLINLRYLDLRIHTLKGIPVGLLPKLSRLQYLRFDVDNEETRLKAEEVVALEKLECFEGRFEDMHEMKKFISSMQLQQCKKNLKYHLSVGSSSYWNFETDKVVSIDEVELDGRDELMLPIDIQGLEISRCHNLRSFSGDDISSLKNAIDSTDCTIKNCEGIECVVSFSSSCSTPPFQSLEKLTLENLPKLRGVMEVVEGFGSGASATTSSILASSPTFSHLKKITMQDCNNMKMLLPHWLLPNLQNLEVIEVWHCKRLEEILGGASRTSEDEENGSSDDIALIKFNLPKLTELRLRSLPELKRICSKSGAMVCDSLQLIYVTDCSKLKRIPPFVPLVGNGQPYEYAPPSLKITSYTNWWESLEWDDHPNFKNLLQPHWKEVYRTLRTVFDFYKPVQKISSLP